MYSMKKIGYQAKGWFTAIAIIIISALILTGCVVRTSGVSGTSSNVEGPYGQSAQMKYVVINNQELARGIQVVDLRSVYVDEYLKADVSVVNKYNRTLNVQYKFQWFDARGMEVDPGSTAWTPLVLYGNESKSIQGVAPNPTAVEYKIHIRNQ